MEVTSLRNQNTGLDARLETLQDAMVPARVRHLDWQEWYFSSPLHALRRAEATFASWGVDIPAIDATLFREGRPAGMNAVAIRKGFQKVVVAVALRRLFPGDPSSAIRRRLYRWIPTLRQDPLLARVPLRTLADTISRNLLRLQSLVSPRVAAAVFSTILNRWCTARRVQTRRRCLFGCQGIDPEDSVEHYSCCPEVRSFQRRFCRLPEHFECKLGSFLRAYSSLDDSSLVACSVTVYAAYRFHNTLRHRNPFSPPLSSSPYLRKAALLSVQSNRQAATLLGARMANSRRRARPYKYTYRERDRDIYM